MAVKFPQYDLPPDLLNGRVSGASSIWGDEAGELLIGDFVDAWSGSISGTAAVSASASCAATGVKTGRGIAAQVASASLSATGKKVILVAASAMASMSTGAAGRKSASGSASVGASVETAAYGVAELAQDERTGSAAVSASASASAQGKKGVARLAMGRAFVVVSAEGGKAAKAGAGVVADVSAYTGGEKRASGSASISAMAAGEGIGFFVRPILPSEISRSVISTGRAMSATAASRQISARSDARAKGAHK